MAKNTYECMFLIDPSKISGDMNKAGEVVHGVLERHDSNVLVSRPWDERRLAYPIKKLKKGLYYITYFETESKNIVNIERDCQLNDAIVRHLVIKIDPKLAESILTLAREAGPTKQDVPDEASDDSEKEEAAAS